MHRERRLGIDCGSRSVKAVLLDENGRTVRSCYRFNRGLLSVLAEVVGQVVNGDEVTAVGVTGSGRNLAAAAVGADAKKTEIVAHGIAVLDRYPGTKTVFDIGGEDGKVITFASGMPSGWRMNHVCGAGTGAVIEAVADRLGVPLEEVGPLALQSGERLQFPGKCGVFCQSAVVSKLNNGAKKSDILMGVLRALASNFLLLVRGLRVGPPFLFQGATARNPALVKALEEELGDSISVPEEKEFMGAIGAAILAGRPERTNFRGVCGLGDVTSEVFVADGCENRCEVVRLSRRGESLGCYGNRCQRCVS